MSGEPLIEFAALLEPIPGDDPSGSSLPFAAKQKLEEDRKEIDPSQWAADDPQRPENPKRADWPAIIGLATETLTETSKDLLVAARLTEALTHVHGFAGLRDGLHLLRELMTTCWDRVRPTIEDGDLEVRAGPFNWLNDADKGARFPQAVRAVPMLEGGERKYGWLQWKLAQGNKEGLTTDEIEKAILATSREHCLQVQTEVGEALQELSLLGQSLNAKLGSVAPGLTDLRAAMEDCNVLIRQIVGKKPAPMDEAGGEDGSAASGKSSEAGDGARRGAMSRAGIYQQLQQLAARLQEMEPHSPIPYLLLKATELGAMPFPQLMKALIRDDGVREVLNRELGIKEEEPT